MSKYNLIDEQEADQLREQALVLMKYLPREDANHLQKEFAKHREYQERQEEKFDPWYVWFMSNITIEIKAKQRIDSH